MKEANNEKTITGSNGKTSTMKEFMMVAEIIGGPGFEGGTKRMPLGTCDRTEAERVMFLIIDILTKGDFGVGYVKLETEGGN